MWHYLRFQKYPQNTMKMGKKWKKKNLDQFWTLDLDQFLTLETPNLGPVSTAHIYVYIYIYTIFFFWGGGACFSPCEEPSGTW